MNVSIHASEPEGDKPAKKILIAAKDFEAGDIIYMVRFFRLHILSSENQCYPF